VIARKPLKPAVTAGQGPLFLDAQTHPALSAALDSLGVNAVLIRPDRYILATATSDLEISALIKADVPSPLALP
jgi:3-(3-hydroxy-phenyl)propionate hydroxylase